MATENAVKGFWNMAQEGQKVTGRQQMALALLQSLYGRRAPKEGATPWDDDIGFIGEQDPTMQQVIEDEERQEGAVDLDDDLVYLRRVNEDPHAVELLEEALEGRKGHPTRGATFQAILDMKIKGAKIIAAISSFAEYTDGLEGADNLVFDTMNDLSSLMQACSGLAFKELRARQMKRDRAVRKLREPTADTTFNNAVNDWLRGLDGERATMDDLKGWQEHTAPDATGWRAASDVDVMVALRTIYRAMLREWLRLEGVRHPDQVPGELMGYVRYLSGGEWTSYTRVEDGFAAYLRNMEEWLQEREAEKKRHQTVKQRALSGFLAKAAAQL